MKWSGLVMSSLAELIFPERCLSCQSLPDNVPWTSPGPCLPGLRAWDRTHLCLSCLNSLRGDPVTGKRLVPGLDPVRVHASSWTNAGLVRLVGEWKYQGIRGLSWPLAFLATDALVDAGRTGAPVAGLVPLPLHRHRQRQRGFNQATLLARLLAERAGIPLREDVIRRVRRTQQQARIEGLGPRLQNTGGAFRAKPPECPGGSRIGLVDDLVTSGATAGAAVLALSEVGWQVAWVLCLGLARSPVDTT